MPRDGSFTETPRHENLRKLSTQLRNLPPNFRWNFSRCLAYLPNNCAEGCAIGLMIVTTKKEGKDFDLCGPHITSELALYLKMDLDDFHAIFGIETTNYKNWREIYTKHCVLNTVSALEVADQIDKYLATVDEKVAV